LKPAAFLCFLQLFELYKFFALRLTT